MTRDDPDRAFPHSTSGVFFTYYTCISFFLFYVLCSVTLHHVPRPLLMPVTCGDLHMRGAPAPAPAPPSPPADLKLPLVTELVETSLSEPEMDIPRMKRIDPPNSPGSFTHPGSRTASRPSSAANSVHHSRSNSRSTARSRPPSRHGSLHSSRRAVTSASIVPVPPSRATPHERRESLIALHRESCRLFNDPESSAAPTEDARPSSSLHRTTSTSPRSRRGARTPSETGGSAPPSPIASSHSSPRIEPEHRPSLGSIATRPSIQPSDRSSTLPTTSHTYSRSSSSIHVPATVMEWTSPSTRRQEYEKIDRASRGMRGLWRRVAPRWCQPDTRTPFFEEGRTSREGSVRRFRMDLPDEDQHNKSQVQILDFFSKGGANANVHPTDNNNPRRLWPGRRSKTCL